MITIILTPKPKRIPDWSLSCCMKITASAAYGPASKRGDWEQLDSPLYLGSAGGVWKCDKGMMTLSGEDDSKALLVLAGVRWDFLQQA